MKTVDVNEKGIDANGNDYSDVAAPEAIRAGLVVNEPICLRYPDGTLVTSSEVRITANGMDAMRRAL
jgi:hypothetical protein